MDIIIIIIFFLLENIHKFLHEISLFYKFLDLLTVLNIMFFLSYIIRSNIRNFFLHYMYFFLPPSLPPSDLIHLLNVVNIKSNVKD